MRILALLTVTAGLVLGGTTGKLTGTVKFKNDNTPLVGCNIVILNTDLGTASDPSGEFTILNIPPGVYSVKAMMIGYQSVTVTQITISVDKTFRLNFSMDIQVVEGHEITVVADRGVIQFDRTNSEARVTSDVLETMPLTEVSDVIKLQGGITQDEGGGIHIRGGRGSEIVYMVDGMSMTDVYDGGISVTIETDNIQELQVISGNFNAEYGKAMSGVINMVTKDGGNTFEGSLNYYSGDHVSFDPVFRSLDTYSPFNDINIAGSLSGPIFSDRVTFYSSGRLYKSKGWLNGLNTFTMYGDTLFIDENNNHIRDIEEPYHDENNNGHWDDEEFYVDLNENNSWDAAEPTLQPEIKPMNWVDKWSSQNKITFKLNPKFKMRIKYILSHDEYQTYDHHRRLTLGGENTHFSNGEILGLNFSHSISSTSYYDLNISQSSKSYKRYVFESLNDPRYRIPDEFYFAFMGQNPDHPNGQCDEGEIFHDEDGDNICDVSGGEYDEWYYDQSGFKYGEAVVNSDYNLLNYYPQHAYARWGLDMSRFYRETVTKQIKFDFNSQINKYNLIKIGIEYQIHSLKLDSYALMDSSENDQMFTPVIPVLGDTIDLSGNQIKQSENPLRFSESIPSWVTHYHPNRSYYLNAPKEFSAYIQDKIEYGDMIVNVGLRYDYFDPNSWVPMNSHEPYIQNPRNPRLDSLSVEERLNIDWGSYSHYNVDDDTNDTTWVRYSDFGGFIDNEGLKKQKGWYKKTAVKSQFSPRLGIAYPISDRGVIHFSYGMFYQIPQFELLYSNPGYKMPETSGKFGIYGDPDLEPQKTTSYELGLQQEITRDLKIEVTGYFRDVRNWVSTGIPIDLGGGASYFTYVNKDYSNVRGVIITVDKQFGNYYGWHVDYTFQNAEGSNSNPDEEFGSILDNSEPRRSIIPLNWDQRHTLNASTYTSFRGWGGHILIQYGSGYPYTPFYTSSSLQGQTLANVLIQNSRRKQPTINFDLKLFKNIKIENFANGRVYLTINNLFDTRNEITIWGDTGRSSGTAEQTLAEENDDGNPLRPNTISDYYNHPEWYSNPRNIQLGLQISL